MEMLDRAILLHRAGDLSAAEALYRGLLHADADNFDALHLLGVLAAQRGQFEAAERLMRAALAQAPADPLCLHHYGNVLCDLGRHGDALGAYDRALSARPDDALLLTDRGAAQHALGRFPDAAASFARALAIDDPACEAHLHLGVGRLLQGDFRGGWEAFGDRRWDEEERQARERAITAPLWRGTAPVAGRTILLQGRHGFGDTLQFCRYAPLLAARGARVVLEVPAAAAPLMATLDGVDRVLAEGEARPAFDLHCSLLSLPFAFRTTPDTLPRAVPYLRPGADHVARWARRLGPKRRPRIGLCWWTPSRGPRFDPRTVDLAALLAQLPPGIDLFVLQRDVAEADRALLAARPDIAHPTGDFLDMAAVILLMDAVISIDSAFAHLAGALGVPTFILLPAVPDWRWLLHRDDTPWYPTARLFRQPVADDWKAPLAQVGRAVAHMFSRVVP